MSGTVQKYGSSWRIRYDAGYHPDGRRRQVSKGGFRTRREAEEALTEVRERVRTGVFTDAGKLTVAAYLDQWLAGKAKLRPSSARSYESHVRIYLKPLIGQLRLADLRATHLDAMYAQIRSAPRGRPLSPTTIRRVHATLHSALESAYRRRLIGLNPAGQVELVPVTTTHRQIWTPTQLASFLDHAAGDRLYALYHLVAFTGLRRGEACGIRWQDLDLDAGRATVAQQIVEVGRNLVLGAPKTRSGARVLALDAGTVAVLRTHRRAQLQERVAWGSGWKDTGLVFTRADGSALRPEYVTRHFLLLSERAAVPRIVFHGLRHTHASHALAAGVDATVVSKRLGHSSISLTLDTYTQVLPEVAQEAADLIAQMVGRARRPVDAL